ncbi:MAG: type VI secretion system tip protein VgrG [Mitsuaria chitosanitabida]|uniref:type VI secretion system Vgr family protein n=1 Tax=Roseateles chitosanitabidus TaxID=65048 RepID=UPI001B0B1290|nr:type VI secretion system tip protein TssI/VgrG [Roseateles chitosanitabidus]MBO9688290.1 type VI secretion system tip protein VgrG [Roseateles chitosanitabidus]
MAVPLRLKTPLPPEDLRVHACSAREGLSELGEITLTLLSERKDIRAADLLGKAATLTVALRDTAPRHLSGYVTRFALAGFEGRHCLYEMTVRPWLWLLTRTADCRIFQDMTVPDIVKAVFDDHPVARHEFRLQRPYRTWTYCVQYRETDFNFVSRLLEHEGIYWYFTHDEGGHTLVLTDSASAHDAAPGCASLPFYGGAGNAPPALEFVDAWVAQESLKPGKIVITDFDFERPSTSLETQQDRARDYDLSDGEVFDYPGGYLQTGDGSQYAEDRLDEIQANYARFDGDTNAQGVATGHLLSLERHPRDDQNAKYLVTGTSMQMRQAATESDSGESTLRCSFSAIPADQQFRPARRTPKPMAPGPQTAIVTGPGGEEIFTDKYGRVKVQFHWDRRGKRDETSSCWIRVSQPWAGKGWGGVSIPRIGQEVVVDFVEGDPDQPLITGRVYNAESMPPYGLPAGAVVSGIKSKTHKGAGYNELSMDDTAGKEMITIHGQYDMATTIEHDQTSTIHNNRTDTVDVDDSETVGNNQTQSVGVNQSISVGSNQTISVGVDRSKTIGANETLTVGANQVESIGATRTLTVGSSDTQSFGSTQTVTVALLKAETIGAAYALTVGAAMNQAVGAALMQEVGAAKVVAVGGLSSEQIGLSKAVSAGTNMNHEAGAKMSHKAGASYSAQSGSTMSFQSGADYSVNSKAKAAVEAASELVLKCGSAQLILKSSGEITLKGSTITIQGSGKIGIKAGGNLDLKGSPNINQNS